MVVFNGDVLTEVDLAAVIALHRERKAKATIVLTPVDNPTAYGLVETDAAGNIQRFLEKPNPDEITCDTINAGIYVLEPDTFDRIPKDTPWSIERSFFPSLIERGETFVAYVDRGYWIDIGTPEKYMQVHRDIMDGRYRSARVRRRRRPRPGSRPRRASKKAPPSKGPASSTRAPSSRPGARIGPYSVVGRQCCDRGARHARARHHLAQHAHQPGSGRPAIDPRPPLPHRPQRPRSRTASCSATSPSSPITAGYRDMGISIDPTIFKAYDIRGVYPHEVNEEAARAIGRRFVAYLSAETDRGRPRHAALVARRWPRRSSTAPRCRAPMSSTTA